MSSPIEPMGTSQGPATSTDSSRREPTRYGRGQGKMNTAQKAFAALYASPESPVFANASRAYQITHPNSGLPAARSSSATYLANPVIRSEIDRILEVYGLSPEVRADTLRTIVEHRATGQVEVSTKVDAEGRTSQLHKHGPGWHDVLKAIDITNKMDGTYAKQGRAAEVAADEYRALLRVHLAPLKARLKARGVDNQRARGLGGEGQTAPGAEDVLPLPTAAENLTPGVDMYDKVDSNDGEGI